MVSHHISFVFRDDNDDEGDEDDAYDDFRS